MLLNALLSAPEVAEAADDVVGKSLYVMRAGHVAGTFLYGVAITAVLIFVVALMQSLRAGGEAPRR